MTFRLNQLFSRLFYLQNKTLVQIPFSNSPHAHHQLPPDFHQTVDKLNDSGTAARCGGNIGLGCSWHTTQEPWLTKQNLSCDSKYFKIFGPDFVLKEGAFNAMNKNQSHKLSVLISQYNLKELFLHANIAFFFLLIYGKISYSIYEDRVIFFSSEIPLMGWCLK